MSNHHDHYKPSDHGAASSDRSAIADLSPEADSVTEKADGAKKAEGAKRVTVVDTYRVHLRNASQPTQFERTTFKKKDYYRSSYGRK